MKFFFVILIIFNIYTCNINAQVLTVNECKEKAASINKNIPEGMVLLLFESDLDLGFESSMEILESPLKEGNIYILMISQRKCVINIENKANSAIISLSFGQMSEKSAPTLQRGEIKYFEVSEENKLNVFDNTMVQKANGAIDNQMLYEKEALLIVNTDPTNLDLKFMSSVKITEVRKEKIRYLVFIKPEIQNINLLDLKTKATCSINITDVQVKDVFYYFVSLPSYLADKNDAAAFKPETATDYLTLAYSDYNIGNTKGALDNLISYSELSENVLVEPSMLLREMLTLERGKEETIKYFEDIYSKNKIPMNLFMMYFSKDDFDNINKMAEEQPDFLPAVMYSVKNTINFFKDIGLKLQNGSAQNTFCEVCELSEKMIEEIKEIEKINKSKFFLKPQTISEFFTDSDKMILNGWAIQRSSSFNFNIIDGLKKGELKEEIKKSCFIHAEAAQWNCSQESLDELFTKLYEQCCKDFKPVLIHTENSTFFDKRDGRTYQAVKIGEQTWMAENLNYMTIKGSWCYNNDLKNCEKLGRLYTWEAALSSCPDGWYLPDHTEWTRLNNYLGGDNYAGTTLTTKGWDNGNNESGFNAIKSGMKNAGSTFNSNDAYFWTSSEVDDMKARNIKLNPYNGMQNWVYGSDKNDAMSIRCLKGVDRKTESDTLKVNSKSTDLAELIDTRDGKSYKTAKIGNQVWMAENLNFAIDKISWCYKDDSANCVIYGRLYNWETAKNACPMGWHLPSDDEWKMLETYLGMEEEYLDSDFSRGTNEGGKLKESGARYWEEPNAGANNMSRFSALPGGYREYKTFSGIKHQACFWTSTIDDDIKDAAFCRILNYRDAGIVRNAVTQDFYGYSVRCIKD